MTRVIDRRHSRLAFGSVLIAGAIALVTSVETGRGHSMEIICLTWLAALAAGLVPVIVGGDSPDRDRFATSSLAVPIIGLALLGPLTIHAVIGAASGCSGRDFDEWVKISVVIAGPAHLALAWLAEIRAAQLTSLRRPLSPGKIYWITVGVSCVPFVLLLVIPPILVALTGLPFLAILRAMEPIAVRERVHLRTVRAPLPFAIARCR